MNSDLETDLTAYFDGELDAEGRQRVESALASDSALSDRLREFSIVHDLVGALPRPGVPVDFSGLILARVYCHRPSRFVRWVKIGSGSRTARVGTLVAAAASLVACATIGIGHLNPDHAGQRRVVNRSSSPSSSPFLEVKPVEDLPSPTEIVQDGPVTVGPPPVSKSLPSTVNVQNTLIGHELLGKSPLAKVFVVSDVLGRDADRLVGDILAQTARHKTRTAFGRIVVDQGIVLESQHEGFTVVFAVVMSNDELREFQELLFARFPRSIQEASPRPEIVAKLSEAGKFSVLSGTAVAGLKPQRTLRLEETSAALRGGFR